MNHSPQSQPMMKSVSSAASAPSAGRLSRPNATCTLLEGVVSKVISSRNVRRLSIRFVASGNTASPDTSRSAWDGAGSRATSSVTAAADRADSGSTKR
ncbi:MAG: hypothetical protein BWX70_02835 [Verrucomicrobia bacterium ADurb.Bin070]|nr:MAG: hypothetical protein BWX70_02835 [Verrucomicrobia bacterium ADurb.Bin070]